MNVNRTMRKDTLVSIILTICGLVALTMSVVVRVYTNN